ncbi:hypothetical protein REMIM1_PC00111 (plasmid) [Rhizobium etli bv. mimosae str. Mim1]|nr:hypothetical protein REMIM1_PC00111 [Rhizobium etli bv. mimosae str. Mim1]
MSNRRFLGVQRLFYRLSFGSNVSMHDSELAFRRAVKCGDTPGRQALQRRTGLRRLKHFCTYTSRIIEYALAVPTTARSIAALS